MALSSACFQVPTLLLIPLRKQLLHTHHNSQPQCHRRTAFQKCFSQRSSPSESPQKENEVFRFEKLFSNLNQATLKREPGSLLSAILLVAGTMVGAGIPAIPGVTQESGFLASVVMCILCWVFMVVTGQLLAEVNVNTSVMCELGSGGVSLVSMAP